MTSNLAAFKAALATGSGRAMILLRHAGREDLAEALLSASTVDGRHDSQCEPDRAPYLARLIETAGLRDALYQEILEEVADWSAEEEGVFHPLSVLTMLAAEHPDLDQTRLKAIIRDRCDNDDAADLLIRLEGYPALVEALEHLEPRFDEDGWMAGGWLRILRERDGAATDRVLAEAAETNTVLKRALDDEQAEPAASSPAKPPMPLDELRAAMWKGQLVPEIWQRRSEADRQILSADLAVIEDDVRALPYLRHFSGQRFLGDPSVLMRWCDSGSVRVRNGARRALEKVRHPAVRALALERLARGEAWALGLLIENFEPGDFPLIGALFDQPLDLNGLHGAGMDVLSIFDRGHVDAAGQQVTLDVLFERTPCSYCRESIVRRRIELGELPRWMAEECLYDANPDTVALVSG